jgi:hypothetical protein
MFAASKSARVTNYLIDVLRDVSAQSMPARTLDSKIYVVTGFVLHLAGAGACCAASDPVLSNRR